MFFFHFLSRALFVLVVCLTLGGMSLSCGDDTETNSDTGVLDDGGVDATLYPCSTPGEACNAHNACAINPVCGEDLFCHPASFQDCNDGLDCTDDVCEGNGLCNNEPHDGFCALPVLEEGKAVQKCFEADTPKPDNPCLKCDPTQDKNQWSSATGGACDDENPCTKDDYCQEGACKGTYYGNDCDDALECTEDICDGQGGCQHQRKADWCQIQGTCIESGDKDSTNCGVCDPNSNPNDWTALTNICKIGGVCYSSGDTDITGCGLCDPSTNDTSWTPSANTCLIDGLCLQNGDLDATGCAKCDPQTSGTQYTPLSGKCLISEACYSDNALSSSGCGRCNSQQDYDWWFSVSGASSNTTSFDSTLSGYTVDPLVSSVGWQLSTSRHQSGAGSLYYGNLTTKNYDITNTPNSGTATSPTISLPSGQKAALWFWLYLDVESTANFDVLSIAANDTTVWQKSNTTISLSNYKEWTPIEVDLSAYAGNNVVLTFSFDTKDAWANTGEGVYIDEIKILTNCGAL